MKKVIYQRLYECLSIVSNRFNNKFLTRIKVLLGTALIVLTSSCNSDSDEPEVTCYLMYVPDDSIEVQSMPAPDISMEVREIEEAEEI